MTEPRRRHRRRSDPVATTDPAHLGAGDVLAAVGELGCARAAQAYAALGYPVVPMHTPCPGGGCTCRAGPACPDQGKHPRLAGWTRLASTDPGVVGWWRRWPDANLGFATGRRFDVLDLDGDQGVEALHAALKIAPWEHPGPGARTGGGGWHLLYAPTGLGNRVKLAPGVDWRGRDGLIVAPPSQHASGTCYAWVRPLTATLPKVPAGLRRLLAPPPATRTTLPPAPTTTGRSSGYGQAALAGERAAVAGARPGSRNATLNRAAFNLGQLAAAGLLDVDQVRAMLLAAALEAGNPEAKARATIESGLCGGAAKPRRARVGGVASSAMPGRSHRPSPCPPLGLREDVKSCG
jgi:Bifunctional DNA primase/polymerase, N-terminal